VFVECTSDEGEADPLSQPKHIDSARKCHYILYKAMPFVVLHISNSEFPGTPTLGINLDSKQ
jgi:hypothetical protein